MKAWEIWVEGHNDMGNIAGASLLAVIVADTFDEAVAAHVAAQSDVPPFPGGTSDRGYYRYDRGEWRMWGCRIYDNEADARKAFG